MTDGHIRVELQRSGGFTGLRRCATMDSDELPEEDARQLRVLVDVLDLQALQHVRSDHRLPALDLTIVRGSERVQATLDESTVPAELRPLIQLLDQRAQPC
ncbi:MAG: protealysin inhibitor emfourin [Streptosporangiales bacterium]